MAVAFPGESAEYRAARDRLLDQEIELRRAMEAVAEARRRLPPGGQTALLPPAEGPCPSCTALLDQLDGAAGHAAQHVSLVVAAKAPLKRVLTFPAERGWRRLRLLSSAGSAQRRFAGWRRRHRAAGPISPLNMSRT
jgi:predicted dithiol-disulfide oxidoreductase (DUF899 family)